MNTIKAVSYTHLDTIGQGLFQLLHGSLAALVFISAQFGEMCIRDSRSGD